ncbi:hypothetical protein K1719_017686 [Acacia pycnantha]|nr:hypothetical protein K1719_017686 [Acacia pycnantha]
MPTINFHSLLVFSVFFRVALILYGEWQDTHLENHISLFPLLAFLLIPNSFIHRSWGKFLFSASDILVGYFIHYVLKKRKVPENLCNYCVMIWLFNPFTFTIGTRGNCEPIVCALVLWIIICLMNGNVVQSAFWYGLVVHFRIYPIIYSIPILLVLDPSCFQSGQKPVLRIWSAVEGDKPKDGDKCTAVPSYSYRSKLVLIFSLAQDLPFCLFVQTVAFVAFNKVITAQYFVWFFCLLPLILPWSKMKLKWQGLSCILLWIGAQIHWLLWGYLLEFKGKNVFLELWAAGLLFLAANVFVLVMTIRHHRYASIFRSVEHANSKNMAKLK